ncbi:MAG: ABC transporter permease [Lachnospiraceae bacterium]|nr:ABC transporter permease [Lachnospiraceae bacterium]
MSTIILNGLAFSLPLLAMALSGIFSERSGVTNLAVEGFQGFGAFCGAFIALVLQQSMKGSDVPYYVALIISFVGGALFALIHALMCIRFKANQVISGVVINIFAMALTAYFTKYLNLAVFGASSDKFVLNIAPKVFGLYTFEYIIVAVVAVAWFVMYKTTFGMYLRACGDNPQAVDAAGVNVAKIRYIAVSLGGGFAGLGGICYAYSISSNFSSNIYSGYGYLAIAALIFGNWNVMPTLFACFLFGFARSAGYQIVQIAELPSSYQDLIMILPYVLTLIMLIFFSKKTHAPRALGVSYDKGSR